MSQGIQKLTVGVDRGIVGRSIAIVPSTILQEDHLVEVEVQQQPLAVAQVRQQVVAQVRLPAVASVVGR